MRWSDRRLQLSLLLELRRRWERLCSVVRGRKGIVGSVGLNLEEWLLRGKEMAFDRGNVGMVCG